MSISDIAVHHWGWLGGGGGGREGEIHFEVILFDNCTCLWNFSHFKFRQFVKNER